MNIKKLFLLWLFPERINPGDKKHVFETIPSSCWFDK